MRVVSKSITEIALGDRVRQDYGRGIDKTKDDKTSLADLTESIRDQGLLQPISIDESKGNELVYGGRRLAACAQLFKDGMGIGHNLPDEVDGKSNPRKYPVGTIPCIVYDSLTAREKLDLERAENKYRKNFTSGEDALWLQRMADMLLAAKKEEAGPQDEIVTVTTREIAKEAGVSVGQVSMGLQVAKAVKEEGRTDLLQSNSILGAYNRMQTTRKIEETKQQVLSRPASHPKDDYETRLHNGDGVAWLKSLPSESVDFINLDTPWGIDLDDYDRWRNYENWDDSANTLDTVFKPMVPELFRVLRPDRYAVVWFGIQFYSVVKKCLETLNKTVEKGKGFKVNPVPNIWFKTDKGGAQNDSERVILNVYEPFFICEKGSPRLFRSTNTNVLPYPMPRNRRHLAQKNMDLCLDLITRHTWGDMVICDPTFGSGAMFGACKKIGRQFIGAELNTEIYKQTVDWLRGL